MSWAVYHSISEQYASEAEVASKRRDFTRAAELYRLAAEQETLALKELSPGKVRTRGITAVSASSLWFKARDFQRAQQVAYQALADELPPFAEEQLQNLLQYIWNELAREKAGVSFAEGELVVSISGGEIVPGGAPMDLILLKVDQIGRIFYRTIEMLLRKPFRRQGMPAPEIREQFRPWLFQAPAGSYQFAVRVETPKQLPLPSFAEFEPVPVEQITATVLDIVKASINDPEGELVGLVPDEDYRDIFLKLTRNLPPTATARSFGRMEIKTSGSVTPAIVLIPESREPITAVLKKTAEARAPKGEPKQIQLKGTLRALHLDQDWLDVDVPEGDTHRTVRIHDTGEAIDDIVGPMVNHRVLVEVIERSEGKYRYQDIQLDE